MTQLWIWNGDVTEPLRQKLYRIASTQRLQRARRFARTVDADRCLLAEALLRLAVPQRTDFAYTYTRHGQPLLEGLSFSWSHSGRYVVCAVSEQCVGVDVQRYDDRRQAAVYGILDEQEKSRCDALCDQQRQRLLFELWSAKEAIGKQNGGGLSFGKQVHITEQGQAIGPTGMLPCRLSVYSLPDAALVLCTDREEIPTVYTVQPQQILSFQQPYGDGTSAQQ